MLLRPTDRARLEAIAESDDPKISPRDRIEAIKLLHASGDPVEAAQLQITRDVMSMTGAQLDEALAAYFAPVRAPSEPVKLWFQDAQQIEEEVERRARDRALALYAERGVRQAEHHAQRPREASRQRASPDQDGAAEERDQDVPSPPSPMAPPGIDPEELRRNWRGTQRRWPPW
jgi:hypothetical protein